MKNKIYILILYCFGITSCTYFQPISPNPESVFIKMFGGENRQEGIAVQVLNESTTYILGHTNSFDASRLNELYLIKVDNAGNEVWAKILSQDNKNNQAVDMILTQDKQHLLILANSMLGQNSQIRAIKTTLEGDIVWDKTYTSPNNTSYATVANLSTIEGATNFLIVGTATTNATGLGEDLKQIYAAELTENGNFVWQKTYNFIDRKAEYGVAIMEYNDNVIVLGQSISANGNEERPIIIEGKRSGIGEELQSKILFQNQIPNKPKIIPKDMMLLSDGNFMILCEAKGTSLIQMAIETEFSITPNQPIELDEALEPTGFSETKSGDLLITGNAGSQIGLVKVATNGIANWSLKTFGEPTSTVSNIGAQVVEKNDETILLVGTLGFFSNQMIGLIKTNSEGKLQ